MALFSFDMGTGNIYGLVGMAMYGYLRNLVFTLMVPVFLYYLVGFLYSNGNPRVKERLAGHEQTICCQQHRFYSVPAAFRNCFIPERCHAPCDHDRKPVADP